MWNNHDQHQLTACYLKSSQTFETSHWTPWILLLSTLPLELDFQMNYKICLHLKIWLWTTEKQTSSFAFYLSSGKMLLTLSLIRWWIYKRSNICAWCFWCTSTSLSTLSVKLSQVSKWIYAIYTILLKLNIIFYDFWFSNVLNVMNTEYMEVDVFYRKKLFAIFKYSYMQ